MGNKLSPNNSSGCQNHDRLGPIKILEAYDHQSNQAFQTMQVEISLASDKIVSKWEAEMKKIDDSEARQVILLPEKYHLWKHGMCGSSGTLQITFNQFSYVLTGEITNRQSLKTYFDQKQVWYLLYNLIRGAVKFHRNNTKIGNIHPDNILMNDEGKIKIISACSLPNEKDNFKMVTQNIQARAFLAPEELSAKDAVAKFQYPGDVDPCIAEIFSIGLTVLSAGTLFDCSELYRKQKNTIKLNKSHVQDLFERFKHRYSEFVSDILSEMIEFNPQLRKCSYDFYSYLCRHESQILKFEPFPQPQKYHETHRLQRTVSGIDSNFIFRNKTTSIMEPKNRPKVQFGSQQAMFHVPSVTKIHTQPLIGSRSALLRNISPNNKIMNPEIPLQTHFLSPIKIASLTISRQLPAKLSPGVRFEKPVSLQKPVFRFERPGNRVQIRHSPVIRFERPTSRVEIRHSPVVRFQKPISRVQIRHQPWVLQKTANPIQTLKKIPSSIDSATHMRYSKNFQANMLSNGHIYVHPPRENRVMQSQIKESHSEFMNNEDYGGFLKTQSVHSK